MVEPALAANGVEELPFVVIPDKMQLEAALCEAETVAVLHGQHIRGYVQKYDLSKVRESCLSGEIVILTKSKTLVTQITSSETRIHRNDSVLNCVLC